MRRLLGSTLWVLAVLGVLSLWNDGPRWIVMQTQINADEISYRLTGHFLPFNYWMPNWS